MIEGAVFAILIMTLVYCNGVIRHNIRKKLKEEECVNCSKTDIEKELTAYKSFYQAIKDFNPKNKKKYEELIKEFLGAVK